MRKLVPLGLLALTLVLAGSALAAGSTEAPVSTPDTLHAGVSPVSEGLETPSDGCTLTTCPEGSSARVEVGWAGAEVRADRPTCDVDSTDARSAHGECAIGDPTVEVADPTVDIETPGLISQDSESSGEEGPDEMGTASTSSTAADGHLALGGAELVVVGLGATGLLMAPPARRLLFLLLSPLATRLRRDRLLEDDTRRSIYEIVNAEPGINLKALGDRLEVAWGTLLHHVRKLEDAHLVVSQRYGKYRRYFPNGGAYSKDERKQVAALASPSTARVASVIQENPGRNQREIGSMLDVSPSTVLWHVKRLEKVDLVRCEREGRCVRYYPLDALSDVQDEPVAAA